MSGEKIPDGTWQEKLIAEARLRQNEREKGYRAQALKIYPSICARCGREFSGKKLRDLTVHHKDHNTRTTQQMGVTGNFCACTVMRMNIPEMTSRMHTKTPLRPLQLGKRHRLLGFDHLLALRHYCGRSTRASRSRVLGLDFNSTPRLNQHLLRDRKTAVRAIRHFREHEFIAAPLPNTFLLAGNPAFARFPGHVYE